MVIQCVTRTSGVCRDRCVRVRAVVSRAGAESDTRGLYHFGLLRAHCSVPYCSVPETIAQTFNPLTPQEKSALLASATSGKLDTIRGPALEYWKTR